MKDYFVLQVKLVFDMAALRSLLVLCLVCALVFEVRKYLVYEASLPPSLFSTAGLLRLNVLRSAVSPSC